MRSPLEALANHHRAYLEMLDSVERAAPYADYD